MKQKSQRRLSLTGSFKNLDVLRPSVIIAQQNEWSPQKCMPIVRAKILNLSSSSHCFGGGKEK